MQSDTPQSTARVCGEQRAQGKFCITRQVMGERLDAADEIVGVELNSLVFMSEFSFDGFDGGPQPFLLIRR